MTKAKELLEVMPITEMANFAQPDVDIPGCIHIWSVGDKKIYHEPRIKYYLQKCGKGESVEVTIEENPRIIGKAKLRKKIRKFLMRFVKETKPLLIKYWHEAIYMTRSEQNQLLDEIEKLINKVWLRRRLSNAYTSRSSS